MTEYHTDHTEHDSNSSRERALDIPGHVNDRQGIVSLFLMGLAVMLLLLLVVAVVQAI